MKIKDLLKKILRKPISLLRNEISIDQVLLNQGKMLESLDRSKEYDRLSNYEWKIFSQWGEDGIINFLINEIEIENHTFIEFGVQDFSESNCRFLLMNKDWSGFVIDGSDSNIKRLINSYYYW